MAPGIEEKVISSDEEMLLASAEEQGQKPKWFAWPLRIITVCAACVAAVAVLRGSSTKIKVTAPRVNSQALTEPGRIGKNDVVGDGKKNFRDNDAGANAPKCAAPAQAAYAPARKAVWPSGSPCNQGLFAERVDGNMRSYNLVLTSKNKAFLDGDATAEEYVPCDVVINYGTNEAQTVSGAKCRYKGSVGSFGGCTNTTTKSILPSNPQCRKLSWKINLKKAQNKEAAMGTKTIQLLGMQHDDSLMKNKLSYAILNDAGFVAPCADDANVYVNGRYAGLSAMIENVDEVFLEKRGVFAAGLDDGVLYKETWPLSPDPDYYKDMKPIPGYIRPGIKYTGKGKNGAADALDYSYLFAGLRRDAVDCVDGNGDGNKVCNAEQATKILDTYVDAQSFIDGIVGMVMVGNWDQIINIFHNFYIYVNNDKLFYVPWDFNEVMYPSIIAAPMAGLEYAGFAQPFPWYHVPTTPEERSLACSTWAFTKIAKAMNLSYPVKHFTCDPVGHLMALAWKDRFFKTFRRVSEESVQRAQDHVDRWASQGGKAVACAADNGDWPPVAWNEFHSKPLIPKLEQIQKLWLGLGDGTEKWPVECKADGTCTEVPAPKLLPNSATVCKDTASYSACRPPNPHGFRSDIAFDPSIPID